MKRSSKIYVAGHRGLVGSAIWRQLEKEGFTNIVGLTHDQLDLTNQSEVNAFFKFEKPEYVFLAAAKVGGIHANNTYPAEFIFSNLQIQNNIIDAAHKFDVKKLLFLGSNCIYPKFPEIPIKESELLNGKLEPTNEPYAIAKIAGINMCTSYNRQYGTNYISAMPTNLYGLNDNYNLNNSHVLPALIRKVHTAKANNESLVLWGDGSAYREFLFSDDLASACITLMKQYDADESNSWGQHINVGSGKEVTIAELAKIVCKALEFESEIIWDTSKPNGTPRKLLDSTKMFQFGWEPVVTLEEGIKIAYEDFRNKYTN